ncbi:MAG TPA: inositol monophosphatase family protein [Dokdonella sp.]
MTPDARFLAYALAVAQRAADAAQAEVMPRWHARDFEVETKADSTPVTEVDRAVEEAIRRVLRDAYPRHGLYGEEAGREGGGDFLWLIDPIDGTRSFVRGYPMFSTQIALMHAGEIVLGVSAAPAYGERAWAVRGGGAWLGSNEQDARRVQVSAAQAFDAQAAVSTGNLKSLAASPARWAAYADIVRRVGRIRGYGDFLHYHLLARGAIDLVVESDLNILDIAPLALIVREAGGVFTDLDGRPVGLQTTSALAGGATLHARALEMFNRTGADGQGGGR